MSRKILIVDSSSVIAMRVKVLLELIGCEAELVHYSMIDLYSNTSQYDLVIGAYGVPCEVVKSLAQKISQDRCVLLAPKAESGEQLSAFSELNKLVPDATVI